MHRLEPVSDMSDEQLFKALERARTTLKYRMNRPEDERSALELHELRRLVLDYDRVLTQRLRAALDSLS